MIEVLKNDYNIEAAERVKPKGDDFELYVTPRFAPTYACGYEQLSTRLVSVLSARIDMFVDVGAHYGYYSMLVGSTNKDAQIIAVEPVLANLELLKRNFEHNNISAERHRIVHAAVSDSNGVTNFYISEASDNCSIYPHPSSETLDEIFVSKVSLDELIPRTSTRKILIKTDTDGHEIEVLKGLELTCKFHHDVMILMEINPKMLAIAHRSVEEIFGWLDAQGYRVFAVDEEDQCFYALGHRVNREVINRIYEKSYYNVICIKKEKTLSLALFSHTAGLDGAGRSLFDLAKGFISRGVICNVVVPSHGLLAEELKTIGCGVLVAPEPLCRVWKWALFDKEDISYQFSSELSNSIQDFLLKIKKIQPDYIISQTITSPWGAVFAELLSIPHALSAREYGVHDHDLNFLFGFQETLNAFYQSSDIVFCVTNDVKNKLFNADLLGKCEVLYSAIELKDNHKLEKKIDIDCYFSNIHGPVFCMPAFLHPGKGQLDLVNSVIDIRKKGVAVKCLLVGSVADEAYAAQVFRCIDDSGYAESFVYLEFTSEIHALLRQVDCVVSCSRFEALGRTLIEASLLEKPIIYANSGGSKEIFQDAVHGLAYDPGNLLDLSACMLRLINDPVSASQRAKTAKLMCEQNFNADSYSGKALRKIRFNISNNVECSSLSKSVLKLLISGKENIFKSLSWAPIFYWNSSRDSFSEENKIFSDQIEFGLFECYIELISDHCKSIRFNPIEGQIVSIDNFSVEACNKQGRKLESNEISIATNSLEAGRHWMFVNSDPQVNMTFAQPVSTLRIWGDIRPVSPYMLVSQVPSLGRTIVDRNEQLDSLSQALAERDLHISSLNTQVDSLSQALAERDLHISSLNAQLAEILSSKSWLLTEPFRYIRRKLRSRPSTAIRKQLADCARRVWRGIPLSLHGKQKLKNVIFSTLSPLFRHTHAYRTWKDSHQFVSGYSGLNCVQDGKLLCESESQYVPILDSSPLESKPVKLICFYLPQFHSIPENDAWWGDGFTEWTNVQPARPQFIGHYQPHVPGELGYYNLLDSKVQQRQVELAKLYGIEGFCFYFYWFDGKRLLEDPIQNYLKDSKLDLPFCLCWANENWCRRWDGLDNEILIAQKHSEADDLAFIQHVAQYMRDPRYIRIDGKPLLLIYRPGLLPSAQDTSSRWRKWCFENGIGEVYLAYTQSFEAVDPAKYGFDAAIEFPPNNSAPSNITDNVTPTGEDFGSTVYDWRVFVERSKQYVQQPYILFRSVCPSWDNTARRKNQGTVFLNSTPTLYQRWLENAIRDTQAHRSNPDERLVFVNAWNEWAEGAHLEPDSRYGYAYLQATRDALEGRTTEGCRRILLVTHDCNPHGAQFLALAVARQLVRNGFVLAIVALDGGNLLSEFAELGPMLVVSSAGQGAMGSFLANCRNQGYSNAITSTVVSGGILPELKNHGFRVLSLIHELSGVIRAMKQEENAQRIAELADQIVFPAELVRDQFATIEPLANEKSTIRPQGLLRKNPYQGKSREAHREVCQRHGLPFDTRIILSIGYLDRRKGADLFVEIAAKVCSHLEGTVFIWVGHTEQELERNVRKRIEELGLQTRVLLVGFDPEPLVYYAAASAYALTSREDPFPNVVLESAFVGVPVVAFEGATGAAAFIVQQGGLLARHLDVVDFAVRIEELFVRQTTSPARFPVDLSLQRYVLDLLHYLTSWVRVSVIVPNYNYARLIERRLDSIHKQTYPVYELIILDDASTDDSVTRIEDYCRTSNCDARLVFNKVNSGSVFRQWVKGVQMATGDLVWIAEADDIANPNFLSTLVPVFSQKGVVLAFCQSRQIDDKGRVIANDYLSYTSDISERWRSDHFGDGMGEIRESLSIKNVIPNVSGVLFDRQALRHALEAVGEELFDYRVAGDWLVYLHVLTQGRLYFCAKSLNDHRRHQQSVTSDTAVKNHLAEVAKVQTIAQEIAQPDESGLTQAKEYLERLREQFGLNNSSIDRSRDAKHHIA